MGGSHSTQTGGAAIVHETVIDPIAWRERYALRRGAVFGLAHGLGQLAANRPGARHGLVRHLHFVGASTRPGNGVPLVLISAEQTAADVLEDLEDPA